MSTKLDEKKKRKREALFTAAFRLFNTKGIRQTSISDIAHEADVAKGTFYLYFKDKFDLRDKLIASKASQILMQAIDELGGNSGLVSRESGVLSVNHENMKEMPLEDIIVSLVDIILNRMEREPELLRFIAKNLSWGAFHQMSVEDSVEGETGFLDKYHQLLASTGRKFENPDLMLFMIVELLGGCSYQVILHQTPVTLDELKPQMYQTIRNIIANQEVR